MLCWYCWNNWCKIYVPIVTLSAEDNAKLSKLLSEGLARSVYWNNYKIIDNIEVNINNANEEKHIREALMPVIKDSKNCLFLIMIIQQVIIKFLLIPSKKFSFKS